MSAHTHIEELLESYSLDERLRRRGLIVAAAIALAGWALSAVAFDADPARFSSSYLVAWTFFVTLALGALFFVMLQHVTGAAWSVTMRRVAENVMAAIPAAALLFLPVIAALPALYEWARPAAVAADPVLQGRAAYLNSHFFLVRSALYFTLWTAWAWRLYRLSARGGLSGCRSAQRWSAPGLVLLTVTVALASFDWLMSLDPHWYSTIFGVYVYSGAALGFVAALILILLSFRAADVLRYSVNHEHYHDLGKWLFALTVFWAYIAFSQYMLIWYGNLPEETVWFRTRLTGSWRGVSVLLVAGHFLLPFFLLISRTAKRKLSLLGLAAVWVLLMHYTDLYWIVMPVFSAKGLSPSWIDLSTLMAVGGTLGFVFWWMAGRHPLAPTGDIRFEKALEFTNV
jgi:hypothetical protein